MATARKPNNNVRKANSNSVGLKEHGQVHLFQMGSQNLKRAIEESLLAKLTQYRWTQDPRCKPLPVLEAFVDPCKSAKSHPIRVSELVSSDNHPFLHQCISHCPLSLHAPLVR